MNYHRHKFVGDSKTSTSHRTSLPMPLIYNNINLSPLVYLNYLKSLQFHHIIYGTKVSLKSQCFLFCEDITPFTSNVIVPGNIDPFRSVKGVENLIMSCLEKI